MRVMDLFPVTPVRPDPFRSVEGLSENEWIQIIDALDDLSNAYDEAAHLATEEWARRHRREYLTGEGELDLVAYVEAGITRL